MPSHNCSSCCTTCYNVKWCAFWPWQIYGQYGQFMGLWSSWTMESQSVFISNFRLFIRLYHEQPEPTDCVSLEVHKGLKQALICYSLELENGLLTRDNIMKAVSLHNWTVFHVTSDCRWALYSFDHLFKGVLKSRQHNTEHLVLCAWRQYGLGWESLGILQFHLILIPGVTIWSRKILDIS